MEALRRIVSSVSWLKIAFVYGENAHAKNSDTKRKEEEGKKKKEKEKEKEEKEENTEEESGEERTGAQTVTQIAFNGLIPSVQLFMVITAATVAVALSTQRSDDRYRPRENWNMAVLVVLMVAGTAVMTAIWKYRRQAVASGQEGTRGGAVGSLARGTEGRGRAARSRVTVIGLMVFYVCGSLLDLLNVVARSNCTSMQRAQCPTFRYSFGLVLHYAFHLFRIVYHGVAAVFCVQFSSCRFVDGCVVRYALMFLQSVNLSIWFDATVHKQVGSSNVTKHGSLYWCEEGGGGGGGENATVSPAPSFAYVVDCNNLTFYRRVEKEVSPLVRPFTIQFSLLVASFFIQWFIGCVKKPRASMAPGPGSPYGAEAREEERWEGVRRMANVYVGSASRDREPEIELDEASPLLGNSSRSSSSINTRSDPSRKRTRNHAGGGVRSAGLKLWIVVVLVANAMLNVFAILGTQSRAFADLFSRVLFFYWFSMTCAVYVGFYVTRRFRVMVERQPSRFTGLDYLLVFTSAGPVGFSVFTFVSVVGGDERDAQEAGIAFTLAFMLFELYQTCCQVTFCLYAARLDVDAEDSGIRSRNATVFRGVIFYLAVSNGALWIAHTVEGISIRQTYQKQFFGHDMWIVINNIMKPLSLFFRFNSCLQFIRIYRKRKAMMARSRPKHSHQQ